MATRRVIILHEPPPGGPGSPYNPNTTAPRAREHTTTTNVVSVVCEAGVLRADTRMKPTPVDKLNSLRSIYDGLSSTEKKKFADQVLADRLLDQPRGTSSTNRDLSMWTEAVHHHLLRVIGLSGGEVAGPGVIRKLLQAGASWQHVAQFMEHSKLQELPVNDRQRVYLLLADLLVKHARGVAQRSGAPLSAKLVANCCANLAGVFDAAFPGYLEAGMAKTVALSQTKP